MVREQDLGTLAQSSWSVVAQRQQRAISSLGTRDGMLVVVDEKAPWISDGVVYKKHT
jgi:hypothetical protein